MDNESLKVLLGSFAEQQFMFNLLLKILEQRNILKPGEFKESYTEKQKYQFSHDLLEELVSRGLKIDGDLSFASPQEPLSSAPTVKTAVADQASGMKS